MNTFPTIDTGPKIKGFGDNYGDDAVIIADLKNGYPFVNELFTFNRRDFGPVLLRHVSQADKQTVMAFYQANKTVAFNWLNEQESVTYEVIFSRRPECQLDGEKDRWRIVISLRQAA